MGTHMKDFHLPLHSRSVFGKNWGGPRVQEHKEEQRQFRIPFLKNDKIETFLK